MKKTKTRLRATTANQLVSKPCNATFKERTTLWKKITFLAWILFIGTSSLHAQISIDPGDIPYTCGSTITLTAPAATANDYSWQSTGAVLLREIGTTGSGAGAITVFGNRTIEAIVNGPGTVTVACLSCPTFPPLSIEPQGQVFNPEISVGSGVINPANGIQTQRPWICLSNSGSTQTITVKNATSFNIFWNVSGGVILQDETYNLVNGEWVSVATLVTSGPNAKKGFVRAYLSDSCGNLSCGNVIIDWEILKDLIPDAIFGVTCLKESNLNESRSTVYSVPDEIAGNAVFNWSLTDNLGVEIFEGDTHPFFEIQSTVLYGNSVTITYKNSVMGMPITPSMAGNFTVKVLNSCGGDFSRLITVSPEAPVTTQETYCVSETIGTQETLSINNPLSSQSYSWNVEGNNNWTIAPSAGNNAVVTFNDSDSGIITVTSSNSSDPGCVSAETIVFINRNGQPVTITGPECVFRGATSAFSFTANPFGRFEWNITPALPTGWTLTGTDTNVLTLTPPAGGVDLSGTYTVTATLEGCAGNMASTVFKIGPAKPVLVGEQCVTAGTTYTYNVSAAAGDTADITITTATGGITTKNTPLPGSFTYTATNEDFDIVVTAQSATDCTSPPTTLGVKVKPIVTDITFTGDCIALGNTPLITFTAVGTGTISEYRWSDPWGGGTQSGATLTVQLDALTAGSICVTPINNGCEGEAFCLAIPRDALEVTFTKEVFQGRFASILATANKSLQMVWTQGATQSDVSGCIGDFYSDTSGTTSFYDYTINNNPYEWVSLMVTDPDTGCTRCYVLELSSIPTSLIPVDFRKEKSFAKSNTIKISPNPAQDFIDIKIPDSTKVRGMVVFDTKGKLIHRQQKTIDQAKLNVSSFAKGMYFIYILTNEGIKTKKIIIK